MGKPKFGKIYRDIYSSTLARDWTARLVFMDMVILSDEHGICRETIDGLSCRTRVPEPIVREAIKVLEAPDPESNSPEEDGRRIIPRNGEGRGWYVVNKAKYYNLHVNEKERKSAAERQKRFREKQREETAPIPAKRDAPEMPEPGCILMPTKGIDTWIRQSSISGWEEKYPDMDVRAEVEAAANWLTLHPDREIPPGGINAWIGQWLYRSKRSGKYAKREEEMDDLIDMSPSEEDLDAHNPKYDGMLSPNGKDILSSLKGSWVAIEDWVPHPDGKYADNPDGPFKRGDE